MEFEKVYKIGYGKDSHFLPSSEVTVFREVYFLKKENGYFLKERNGDIPYDEGDSIVGPVKFVSTDSIVDGPFSRKPNTNNTKNFPKWHMEQVICKYIEENKLPEKFERAYETSIELHRVQPIHSGSEDIPKFQTSLEELLGRLITSSTTPTLTVAELKSSYRHNDEKVTNLSIDGCDVAIFYDYHNLYACKYDNPYFRTISPLSIKVLGTGENQRIINREDLEQVLHDGDMEGSSKSDAVQISVKRRGIKYTVKGDKEPTYIF